MADFNINAVARKVSFTGASGVGPYSFSFEILDDDDVAVYFNETVLTKTTDYSVTINANGTGSVTLVVNVGGNVPATPDSDDLIIIVGARDIERTTDFVTAGDLKASALNEQLDALTIFVQQIAEETARSVKAPVFDPTGITMILPKKADRVNAFLSFDANGDVAAAVPSDDVTTLAEVATDIKILADIEDGTVATDAISDTAAIASDVSTVAGISSNVTTVAGNTSNINAVAADATDIGTVAANIADVSSVAAIDTQVSAVAADATDIGTVATDLAGSDTIGTVAGIAANVTTVAGVAPNVTTVAGISSDVTAVAGDAVDIGTVSTNIANVNTVAGISGNVTTVAGISANVTTVAGDQADIGTVATNLTTTDTIGTVATNIANVNTVGGISADVTTVAGDSADIQLLADNIATISDKVNQTSTTGAAEVPSGTTAQRDVTPSAGYLRFNTTDSSFEGYDGSAWGAIGGAAGGYFVGENGIIGDATTLGDIIRCHEATLDADVTIPTNTNGMAAGPLTTNGTITVNGTLTIV